MNKRVIEFLIGSMIGLALAGIMICAIEYHRNSLIEERKCGQDQGYAWGLEDGRNGK